MSEGASAYRSFKWGFIPVAGLISVPVLSMVIMSVTAGNIENVWTPLQPVLTVTWLIGIIVWALSPFAAMIAFFALGIRAAGGILAGFGAGTLAAVLAALLVTGAEEVMKRL